MFQSFWSDGVRHYQSNVCIPHQYPDMIPVFLGIMLSWNPSFSWSFLSLTPVKLSWKMSHILKGKVVSITVTKVTHSSETAPDSTMKIGPGGNKLLLALNTALRRCQDNDMHLFLFFWYYQKTLFAGFSLFVRKVIAPLVTTIIITIVILFLLVFM